MNTPDYIKVTAGRRYRLIKAPAKEIKNLPAIGLVGDCKWTSSIYGANIKFDDISVTIPFDCLEEANEEGIDDAILVTLMLQSPEGVLKILRGLWRMTKNPMIRNLMERGELPDTVIDISNGGKTKKDYEENWDDVDRWIDEEEKKRSMKCSNN